MEDQADPRDGTKVVYTFEFSIQIDAEPGTTTDMDACVREYQRALAELCAGPSPVTGVYLDQVWFDGPEDEHGTVGDEHEPLTVPATTLQVSLPRRRPEDEPQPVIVTLEGGIVQEIITGDRTLVVIDYDVNSDGSEEDTVLVPSNVPEGYDDPPEQAWVSVHEPAQYPDTAVTRWVREYIGTVAE